MNYTARKMSKYGVFSGAYFPAFGLKQRDTDSLSVFSPNAGKYGPEKTPFLGSFYAVLSLAKSFT